MNNNHYPPPPFFNAYWVVPGKLLAGPFPGSLDPVEAENRLRALAGCGVRAVANLMKADEANFLGEPFKPYHDELQQFAGEEIEWARFPVIDMDIPTDADMVTTLNAIDGWMDCGLTVYVHCWGGLGRTGTVVGCWLARHGIATGRATFKHLRALRSAADTRYDSPQTPNQINMVHNWKIGR